MSARFIGGVILLYFSSTMSSAGGIGGGGVNVPIFLVAFGYDYSKATILSLCTVLGNYISQTSINWNKRHPYVPARPLIYWDAVLVLLPAQMGGSALGVIIATMFPETIMLILAIFILIYAGVKTGKKGLSLWRKESEAKNENIYEDIIRKSSDCFDVADEEEDVAFLGQSGSSSHGSRASHQFDRSLSNSLNPIHEAITRIDKVEQDENDVSGKQVKMVLPWTTIKVLAAVWFVYAIIFICTQTAVDYCSAAYFILIASTYPIIIGTIYWSIRHIAAKQRVDFTSVVEGDLNFNKLSFFPPLAAFGIGIISSLLGIGGGELMGPLLLAYHIMPQVSTATTSIMSLLNTASNIVHYAILGKINYELAAIMFIVGLSGGATGRYSALKITERFGRYSILIFMLCCVLFVSMCLLIYRIVDGEKEYGVKSMC